jgi:hypothetical protein
MFNPLVLGCHGGLHRAGGADLSHISTKNGAKPGLEN